MLWFDLFDHSHNINEQSVARVDWPDGDTYFEQENLMIELFDLIASEIMRMRSK